MEEEELGLPSSDGHDLLNGDNAVYSAGAPSHESIEERLVSLLESYRSIAECCKETGERLSRLENHTESLRKALLTLAHKIDIQTGYARY
ncbi:putative fusion protein-like protein [Seal parapoxvirus]|uniref:Putative fusion protein-like protein n=1 Tax=Seal parapoxvirus TaxID=187984 RepID=A0A1Z4CGH0_9POXV|nr:putative fusion protein-like protein [Seal parapoxvirus]ASF89976.1 putative fusion protein-like protein [Seal parapoxvirus]